MKIPEGWPTREMIDAAWRGYTGINATEKLTRAVTAALAAAPTPPVQDEPKRKIVDEYSLEFHLQKHGIAYAHRTQSDKLRKAAEEAIEAIDSMSHSDLLAVRESLRAALEGK